jgi:hypothetical protein
MAIAEKPDDEIASVKVAGVRLKRKFNDNQSDDDNYSNLLQLF